MAILRAMLSDNQNLFVEAVCVNMCAPNSTRFVHMYSIALKDDLLQRNTIVKRRQTMHSLILRGQSCNVCHMFKIYSSLYLSSKYLERLKLKLH